jgi:hypothetical protein
MRTAVLGVLLSLIVPAGAGAAVRTIAPPGNSGVSQYQEDVPTAKGNRPSNTITPGTTNGPGPSSGSGSSSGAGSSSSGGSLSSSTLRALDRQGSAGRGAAALAQATAPGQGGASRPTGIGRDSQEPGSSPASSLVKALTGSSNGGGLGALLPIILAVTLVAATALALLRRRRTT